MVDLIKIAERELKYKRGLSAALICRRGLGWSIYKWFDFRRKIMKKINPIKLGEA